MAAIKLLDKNCFRQERNLYLLSGDSAFAIPLVLLLSIVLMIYSTMLINTNVQSKKQKNTTLHSTKALFMAYAGVQHFKVKYKIIPTDMFEAGKLYYGFSTAYIDSNWPTLLTDGIKNNNLGTKYPHFLAAYAEDVASYNSTSPTSDVTEAENDPVQPLAEYGGVKVWRQAGRKIFNLMLGSGGFTSLQDADANEDFSEWGYKLINIRNGSLKTGSDASGEYIEQAVTITIEGKAKINVGLKAGESGITRQTVTETILVKKYTNMN